MRIQRVLGGWATAFVILLLAACGGGGADTLTDDGDNDGGDTPTDPTVTVADLVLLTSSPQLPSSADETDEGVTIFAQVIDDNGAVTDEVDVTFSVPVGSAVLVPTDDSGDGTQSVVLITGGDPTNRTITVTASAGGLSETVDVAVVGTTLTLNGPTQVGFDQVANYTAVLEDAEGEGLSGVELSFETTAGSIEQSSQTTDANGAVSATVTASADGTVTAQALGLTAESTLEVTSDEFVFLAPEAGTEVPLDTPQTFTVQWLNEGSADSTAGSQVFVSTTRGTPSVGTATLDADGQLSFTVQSSNAGGAVVAVSSASNPGIGATRAIEFVAEDPATIDVQVEPATIAINSTSTVTAIVRDDVGNLVKNVTVNFTLDDVTGGTLSAPSAVTNSQGTATVTYTSSNVASADAGVEITASVASGSISDSIALTVGGTALRIVLGTGNEMFEPTPTSYDYPYAVIVTDAAGNPVPDATFRISVLPHEYYKGFYVAADIDGDGEGDVWATRVTTPGDQPCDNEDVDFDGILDPGEDFNGNGSLEPGNVVSVPSVVALDENGFGEFNLRYPQEYALWTTVRLRAIASVDGTETTEEVLFNLPALASDLDDLDQSPPSPNGESPFGTASNCANPN